MHTAIEDHLRKNSSATIVTSTEEDPGMGAGSLKVTGWLVATSGLTEEAEAVIRNSEVDIDKLIANGKVKPEDANACLKFCVTSGSRPPLNRQLHGICGVGSSSVPYGRVVLAALQLLHIWRFNLCRLSLHASAPLAAGAFACTGLGRSCVLARRGRVVLAALQVRHIWRFNLYCRLSLNTSAPLAAGAFAYCGVGSFLRPCCLLYGRVVLLCLAGVPYIQFNFVLLVVFACLSAFGG